MLPITVNTESGEVRSEVTAEELAELIGRLGGDGDRFAVVERLGSGDEGEEADRDGDGGDHYIQTWHEGDGPYEVEYREGSAERHFGVRMNDAEEVAAVFVAWARGTEGWADGHAWERVELPAADEEAEEPEGELDPALLEEAEDHARMLVHRAFDTAEEVAEAVSDYFYADGGTPVPVAAARRIVGRLWRERLAEQETWPEVTDFDRLSDAFAALEKRGVTARMHFTCCGNCGRTEIGAEAAPGDHGFVFFHHQSTEAAAEGHGLSLSYGGHWAGPDADAEQAREVTAAVGREVVAALTGAGLPAVWDGDPDRVIDVEPMGWRKRLPAS
ncbi:hypothetical protein [Streptomyces sp. ISL-11]|uniref:DUF6891 domain-containing protein n=1 Tax=Streptomyces sp. ISL-11 TaxID=2819174 RepID=UPI001BE72590|nr:hypothetical protein [Streptomyces sp. ISL-11]MBT2384169.1 hypothetical protein [Streptomyces sp. ISL-11]